MIIIPIFDFLKYFSMLNPHEDCLQISIHFGAFISLQINEDYLLDLLQVQGWTLVVRVTVSSLSHQSHENLSCLH